MRWIHLQGHCTEDRCLRERCTTATKPARRSEGRGSGRVREQCDPRPRRGPSLRVLVAKPHQSAEVRATCGERPLQFVFVPVHAGMGRTPCLHLPSPLSPPDARLAQHPRVHGRQHRPPPRPSRGIVIPALRPQVSRSYSGVCPPAASHVVHQLEDSPSQREHPAR